MPQWKRQNPGTFLKACDMAQGFFFVSAIMRRMSILVQRRSSPTSEALVFLLFLSPQTLSFPYKRRHQGQAKGEGRQEVFQACDASVTAVPAII